MNRIVVGALLGVLAYVAPAQAVLIQQTYTGSVSSGSDFENVFGFGPNTDLAGKSFSAVFVFDTAAGNTTTGLTNDGGGTFMLLAGGVSPADPYFSVPSPLVSATLSIGGSAPVGFAGGYEDRTAVRSFPVPYGFSNEYFSSAMDVYSSYLTVFVRTFLQSLPADLSTVPLKVLVEDGVVVGDQFRLVNHDTFSDQARGFLNPTKLTVALVDPGTEVPLPAALPRFAAGLGVIGVLARRRRRR